MQGLGGSHVNAIGQRCHHQSSSVTQIFKVVKEAGVQDEAVAPALPSVGAVLPVLVLLLQLRLPLEVILGEGALANELLDDITRVGIEGNHNHDPHAVGLVELSAGNDNQRFKLRRAERNIYVSYFARTLVFIKARSLRSLTCFLMFTTWSFMALAFPATMSSWAFSVSRT